MLIREMDLPKLKAQQNTLDELWQNIEKWEKEVNAEELIDKLKEHFSDEDTVMVEENAYWSVKEVIRVIKENT